VTVRYLGSELYAPATASTEITIHKGETTVAVNSQVVTYVAGGHNTSGFISTSPEASHVTFAVDVNLGASASADAGFAAYVNIPNLINLDGLPQAIRPYLERALGTLEDGSTMTVSELRSALELLANGMEEANGVLGNLGLDFSFDAGAANLLVGILEQIEHKLKTLVTLVVWVRDVGPVGMAAQELTKAEDFELRLAVGCKTKESLVVVVVHGNNHIKALEILLTHLS
jgi:hypothetical protein